MHTIQVLATCCRRYDALYESAQQALVIDGKVVSTGTVLPPAEIARLLALT